MRTALREIGLLIAATTLLIAAGCHDDAAKAQKQETKPERQRDGTFQIEGTRYIEAMAGDAEQSETLPMIVFIHGNKSKPEKFRSKLRAMTMKARLILPYGPLVATKGFGWFPTGTGAHDKHAELAAAMPPIEAKTLKFIAAVRASRPTKGKVILAGMSQGSELAYGLVLHQPDMFAAACLVSGQLPPESIDKAGPGAKPPIHAFHGDADDTVDLADDQRTIAELKKMGFPADLRVLPGGKHKFEPAETMVHACLTEALGGPKAPVPINASADGSSAPSASASAKP
jgi:phospholipase/carboxylesterase